MTTIKTIFLFLVGFSNFAFAQKNCNCESDFQWMKKTFEENDAGFKYILEKKGENSYKIHNEDFLQKVKNIKSDAECTRTLYEWLKYFRNGHIAILSKNNQNNILQEQNSNPKVETRQVEIVKINFSKFQKYLSEREDTDLEGIWESEPYIIGVKKFRDNYKGFIIETTADNWKPKEIKFTLDFDKKNGIYYLKNKNSVDVNTFEMLGKNHFKIGQYVWTRKAPKFEDEKAINLYFKYNNTSEPFLEKLNQNTIYFRIPSFAFDKRKGIEDLINENKSLISNTENLIIDLRYNGGGSDNSFREILPFLYTNPIRNVGVQFLSTEVNNKYIYNLIENSDKYGISEESKLEYQKFYDKLNKNIGKFVDLGEEIISINRFSTILPFPKNVGIIINEGNASTTEQFLLVAKQSKKVKLFGTTTMGALDVSNMNTVESPCKNFELKYATSKSFRIPTFPIDDIGIQPDYFIDSKIPEYRWIEYVNEVLNGE